MTKLKGLILHLDNCGLTREKLIEEFPDYVIDSYDNTRAFRNGFGELSENCDLILIGNNFPINNEGRVYKDMGIRVIRELNKIGYDGKVVFNSSFPYKSEIFQNLNFMRVSKTKLGNLREVLE